LKAYKLLFVLLASAVLSTAVLADGIDPQVIIKPGGGSTPITLKNPNPTVTAPAAANTGQCTDPSAPACVFDVFQNQTGSTIATLTIFIPTIGNLIFSCGDPSTLTFDFNTCNTSNVAGGTDVVFTNSAGSPFSGVPTATKSCDDEEEFFSFFSRNDDDDDCKFVGGEFAVDIEGAGVITGTVIPVTAITTPEPGAALLMVFGALAFGLLAVGRRFV